MTPTPVLATVARAGRAPVSQVGQSGRRARAWWVVLALALATVALPAQSAEPPSADGPAVVQVHLDQPLGPVRQELVGFGWHDGGAPLSTIATLDPHLVRIDASLEHVSTGPNDPLQLAPLLERVAQVRAVGGEPLVILSYLPAWLGAPGAYGRDPTRVRPSDPDVWERLVHDVVLALATAPAPALRFEAWNEPDVPLFWQDTPTAWVDTVERSARAVAAVERETGLDLAFGGPAVAVPDPVYLVPFLTRFRDPSLPLDFVSWHYYGNYPFFGPDGAEFSVTEAVQPVVGQRNPIASPAAYGYQIDFMRTLTELTLAGSGRAMPALILDEWNLSAAGFDRRHDTADNAAFAAGVLIEMQRTGLDAAGFFRANDTRGVPGEHGAVTVDGVLKPVWWAFDLWQRQATTAVATTGADDPTAGLWASAATEGTRVTVLLSSFRGTGDAATRTVRVEVPGGATATVRRIDGATPSATSVVPVEIVDGVVHIQLPTPGVALLEIELGVGP